MKEFKRTITVENAENNLEKLVASWTEDGQGVEELRFFDFVLPEFLDLAKQVVCELAKKKQHSFVSYFPQKGYADEKGEVEAMRDLAIFCEQKGMMFSVAYRPQYDTWDFGDLHDVSEFVIAKQKLDEFADMVNSLTKEKNGKRVPLSVAERYALCYRFVANRLYRDNKFFEGLSRNWISALTGDEVVCAGFANLLKCVCDRVFDKTELVCVCQGCVVENDAFLQTDQRLFANHVNNIVALRDPEYGIDAITYADACWDCTKRLGDTPTFEWFLRDFDSISKLFDTPMHFDGDLMFYAAHDNVHLDMAPFGKSGKNLLKPIATFFDVRELYECVPLYLAKQKCKPVCREDFEKIVLTALESLGEYEGVSDPKRWAENQLGVGSVYRKFRREIEPHKWTENDHEIEKQLTEWQRLETLRRKVCDAEDFYRTKLYQLKQQGARPDYGLEKSATACLVEISKIDKKIEACQKKIDELLMVDDGASARYDD